MSKGYLLHVMLYMVTISVAFTMYDLNKNGYITRDEFKVILNMMVGANITPEQVCFDFFREDRFLPASFIGQEGRRRGIAGRREA